MLAGDAVGEDRVEGADAEFFGAVVVPAVENPAEEFAVLGRRDGEICNLAGCGVTLDTGDELQVPDVVFDEKVEKLIWVLDVFIV